MTRALLLLLSNALAANAMPDDGRTRIFDSREGLGSGWNDLGWAPRSVARGASAAIDFSRRGGWILANHDLSGSFAQLTFRMRAPEPHGDFLEVWLDSSLPVTFARIRLGPTHRRAGAGGYTGIVLSLRELNPNGARFDRVVFQAFREVGREPVLLDDIALVAGNAQRNEESARAPRPVRMSIDCRSPTRPISPLIYGIAGGDPGWWHLGATARRWGGNANTRYNWELGNAWNAGHDWFFRNTDYGAPPGPAWARFIDEGIERGVRSVITLPTIGWVAKDTRSYSFPVSLFGPQRAAAPENRDMGNGLSPEGTALKPLPPSRTSVPAPPSFIARWVTTIQEKDQGRNVAAYILDNEPMLWNSTHRDVHPEAVTYDELLERTIAYGSAIRKADPEAVIAGPALWGWTAYHYSAADAKGGYALHFDRRAHGNVPLLPWWLRSVREHEKRTGVRLIDLVDVHFYPQGGGIGIGAKGATDAKTAALRIRSTRALWDPSYVDESWIKEPVMLIPRLHRWVEENAPGLGISIGEYNFGAEGHMSGGLALAEALGRFGQSGLTSAYYWMTPPKDSPAFWAFRAYRDFDGEGAHFLDESVPARSDGALASIFASRDAGGDRLVAVLLNFDPDAAAAAQLDLAGCGKVKSRRVFRFAAGDSGIVPQPPGPAPAAHGLRQLLPAYSMVVLDLSLVQSDG